MGTITRKGMDVNQRWIDFKGVIIDCVKEQIVYEMKENIRKPCVTEDMISKMDERRNLKNKNFEYGRQNIDS